MLSQTNPSFQLVHLSLSADITMGASLTSPLPHRPPTSVCNHLFVAPDAPPIFRNHPLTTQSKKHQSVFAAGWNWSKKAAQQVYLVFRSCFNS